MLTTTLLARRQDAVAQEVLAPSRRLSRGVEVRSSSSRSGYGCGHAVLSRRATGIGAAAGRIRDGDEPRRATTDMDKRQRATVDGRACRILRRRGRGLARAFDGPNQRPGREAFHAPDDGLTPPMIRRLGGHQGLAGHEDFPISGTSRRDPADRGAFAVSNPTCRVAPPRRRPKQNGGGHARRFALKGRRIARQTERKTGS